MNAAIRCWLEMSPTKRKAELTLRLLLEGIGAATQIVSDIRDAELVYSQAPPPLPERQVWIPADMKVRWDSRRPSLHWAGALPLLGERFEEVRDIPGDLLFSAYAILCGLMESPGNSDPWGVPIVYAPGLQDDERCLLQTPVIATYCELLDARLRQTLARPLAFAPRWPAGKRYAVVVSHDVDQPFSRVGSEFRKLQLRTRLGRRDWRGALRSTAALAIAEVQESLRSTRKDPNFCFESWMELERKLQTTSCFYVAVKCAADADSANEDVLYRYDHPLLEGALRTAVANGWEVGLHASIRCWEQNRFAAEKSRLETVVGKEGVTGVRHHYWSMDPEMPERTLALHYKAGFLYDSSLGLNDAPGFRRGMIWPYRPIHPESDELIGLVEVPPTLMDGGIFYHDLAPEAAIEQLRAHIRQVSDAGGAVVLDWHLEQLNGHRLRGAGPALTRVLSELAGDSDVFWSGPAGMAEWWRTRSASLATGTAKTAD